MFRLSRSASLVGLGVLASILCGCEEHGTARANAEPAPADGLGNPQAGAIGIVEAGCGSCHSIPGIAGANGLVGPPLDRVGSRIYLAGLLRNIPGNMVQWLRDPQRILPGNVMPNMNLSEEQARDIAAYLYTLR